jgi:hypothetical protein
MLHAGGSHAATGIDSHISKETAMHDKTRRSAIILALFVSAAMPALADHNSVWGAGKANMPNDIHNTRIEEANTGLMTSEEWRTFVSKGAGAATVNRYLDEDGDGIGDRVLPSQTNMNWGAVQSDRVQRDGRPETSPRNSAMIDRPESPARLMNDMRVERPTPVSRGRQ